MTTLDKMAAVLLAVIAVSIVLFTFWLVQNERSRKRIDKIPGPAILPILGNAHQLSPDGKTFYSQLMGFQRTFSADGVFRLWLCNKLTVAVYRAEYLETLLNSSKHMDKAAEYRFLHPWLGTGLLTSTGDKWKVRRKMLTPTFHFKILHDFNCVFNDQAAILSSKLQKMADKGPFNIFPFITLCALDIICETAMGRNVNAQGNSDSDYVQAVYKITDLILLRMRRPWYWPDFLFYTIGSGRQHDRYLKTLHSFTEKVIWERSQEFRNKQSDQSMEDMIKSREDDDDMYISKANRLAFLDMLLCATTPDGEKLSFEDIREEVDTFMFEGHDTTAAAMSFAIHLIGANPDIQDKLHKEQDRIFGDSKRPASMKDVAEMKYLECTIKEALRLFPSVPFFARSVTEDFKIGDKYELTKGTTAVVVTVGLHADERYFPDAEKFDPDRFLPENTTKRHPYAYIPFSAGPRNCIGQKFALLEEKVVLSTILRKFHITSTQEREDLNPIGELILRPELGIDVKLQSR